jgi:hypothetical protein
MNSGHEEVEGSASQAARGGNKFNFLPFDERGSEWGVVRRE